MDIESLKKFRDRFDLPITDEQVENLSFYKPAEDSPEMSTWLSAVRLWAVLCRNAAER